MRKAMRILHVATFQCKVDNKSGRLQSTRSKIIKIMLNQKARI
jgi:hypothetical protein